MRYLLITLLFLFSFCSNHNQLVPEKILEQFEGYSVYFNKGTVFINSFENFEINNCSPVIVYYSGNKIDSISNKLNDENTRCILDTIKVKLLAQKFIDLYPKYGVTNLCYFPNYKMSFGYSMPSKPEFIKFFNDSLINKSITIERYRLHKNGWYELK